MKESLVYVLEWIEREFEAGLPFFRSVPYSHTKKLIDGFDRSNETEKTKVLEAAIAHAYSYVEFLISPKHRSPVVRSRVFESLESKAQGDDIRYMSLKEIKMYAGYFQPDERVAVSKLESVKAASLRKDLKVSLMNRFGLKPVSQGAGEWVYVDEIGNLPTLAIDFGGSIGQQIRYRVHASNPRIPISIESLFGFGNGDWDYVHEGNKAASFELLFQAYTFLTGLLSKVQNDREETG